MYSNCRPHKNMVINLSDCQFWILSRYTRTNQHYHPSSVARGTTTRPYIRNPIRSQIHQVYMAMVLCVCLCVYKEYSISDAQSMNQRAKLYYPQTFGEGRKTMSQKDNTDMIGWLPRRITSSTPIFAELQSSGSLSVFGFFLFLVLVLVRHARSSQAHSLLFFFFFFFLGFFFYFFFLFFFFLGENLTFFFFSVFVFFFFFFFSH